MILFLQVFILNILPKSLFLSLCLFELFPIFFFDSFDHVIELFNLGIVSPFHFFPLSHELILKNSNISSELFLETHHTRLLNFQQCLDMDQMVTNSNLILVLSLIQVFVQHLDESFLRIKLSLIVLWVDVDLVLQLLRFCDTHDLTPVSQKLLFVKIDNFVLVFNFGSKNFFFHFG